MNNFQFKVQGEILGVKKFKGTIEGNDIDQCKVIVATPLDESSGNALGLSVSEYKFGSSINFERFRGVSFPVKSDLMLEMTTNGKSQRVNVLDFQLIKPKV